MKLIISSDSDYEFLLYAVTKEQIDDFKSHMDNTSYSLIYSVHRFELAPNFYAVYISIDTHDGRAEVIDYLASKGASIEHQELD